MNLHRTRRHNKSTIMKKIILTLLIGFFIASCVEREEAIYPISHRSGYFLKKSIEINKKIVANEEFFFDSIIKANPDREYLLSQKGYWYTFIEKSQAEKEFPKYGDLVYFDSEIYSVTGDTIYKEGDLETKEYAVDKEKIIIGLQDGIKRMKKGEKAEFLLPSHVAYGYLGDRYRIGMNIPIIYVVTIKDVKKKENY